MALTPEQFKAKADANRANVSQTMQDNQTLGSIGVNEPTGNDYKPSTNPKVLSDIEANKLKIAEKNAQIKQKQDKIQADLESNRKKIAEKNAQIKDENSYYNIDSNTENVQENKGQTQGVDQETGNDTLQKENDDLRKVNSQYQKTFDEQNKINASNNLKFTDTVDSLGKSNKGISDSIQSMINKFNVDNGTTLGVGDTNLNSKLQDLEQKRKDGLIDDNQFSKDAENIFKGAVNPTPVKTVEKPIEGPKYKQMYTADFGQQILDLAKSGKSSPEAMLALLKNYEDETIDESYTNIKSILETSAKIQQNQYDADKLQIDGMYTYNYNIATQQTEKALEANRINEQQLKSQREEYQSTKDSRMAYMLEKNANLQGTMAAQLAMSGITDGGPMASALATSSTLATFALNDYEKQLNSPIIEIDGLLADSANKKQDILVGFTNTVMKIGLDGQGLKNDLTKNYQNNLISIAKDEIKNENEKKIAKMQSTTSYINELGKIDAANKQIAFDKYKLSLDQLNKQTEQDNKRMEKLTEYTGFIYDKNPETGQMEIATDSAGMPIFTIQGRKDIDALSKDKLKLNIENSKNLGYYANEYGQPIEALRGRPVPQDVSEIITRDDGSIIERLKTGGYRDTGVNIYDTNSSSFADYSEGVENGYYETENGVSYNCVEGQTGGQCGRFVNNNNPGLPRYGDSLQSKVKLTNSPVPVVGGDFVQDVGTKYGHVGKIESIDDKGIHTVESNLNGDEKIVRRTIDWNTAEKLVAENKLFFRDANLNKEQEQQPKIKQYTDAQMGIMASITNLDSNSKKTLRSNGMTDEDWGLFNDGKLPATKVQKEEANNIIKEIDKLLNHKGLDKAVGQTMFNLLGEDNIINYGSDAQNFANTFSSFRDQLVLPNLGKLKGPMSDKDIIFLRNTATSAKLSNSPSEFKKQLNELKNKYKEKITGGYVEPTQVNVLEKGIISNKNNGQVPQLNNSNQLSTLARTKIQNTIFNDLQKAEQEGNYKQKIFEIKQELKDDGLNPDDYTWDVAP